MDIKIAALIDDQIEKLRRRSFHPALSTRSIWSDAVGALQSSGTVNTCFVRSGPALNTS